MSNLDRRIESGFLLFLLLWSLYVIAGSLSYDPFLAWFLPLITGVSMVVFLVSRLYRVGTGKASIAERVKGENVAVDREVSTDELLPFASLLMGFVVAINLIGFFLAMPIFLFAFFTVFKLYRGRNAVYVTLIAWIVTCILFGVVFDVSGINLGPFTRVDLGLF